MKTTKEILDDIIKSLDYKKATREVASNLRKRITSLESSKTPEEPVEESPKEEKKKSETTKAEPLIVRGANKITLPEGMSYESAIQWLTKKKTEEQTEIAINHRVPCYPLDGLVAFHKALARKYGWTELQPTPGFFGPNPPTMVGVPISPTEEINVPFGRVAIPGMVGFLSTHVDAAGEEPAFIIGGQSIRKHEADILAIADMTRKIVYEESIYKGKAIKVDYAWQRANDDFHIERHAPRFLDIAQHPPGLIFSKAIESNLQIGLFGPIEHAATCRRFKIPLKRGILLYGRYGTGKTLTAWATAVKAVKAGFTFIYLSSVLDLKRGLDLAQRYAPAVLFAEDIDRVVTGPRTGDLDSILNTLDGVDTKNGEVITVFTTNHLENINKAALRAGRLDSLIEVLPPDAEAAVRLVQHYIGGLLAPGTDLDPVGAALAGRIPSTIREVVERSKIAAIVRLGDDCDITGHISAGDLLQASEAMKAHEAMLIEDGKPHRETVVKLFEYSANGDGKPQQLKVTR